MGRDFFFLTPQRACEARTLLARETLRLKGLFCGTAKEVMRKLSFVKVAMY